MDAARWATTKEIFNAALLQPDAARADWIAARCGADAALRVQVESLLAAHREAGDFLAGGGAAGERPGDVIDGYQLVERLGEGGFATVFLAEQTEPLRRQVALKIVKPGMDSAAVLRRFEAERQALARMEHPNIAAVYAAGTTPRGRPYFAMELVRGVPITEYCRARALGVDERLGLFQGACAAVHHAHAKGVVHRDLKPDNVLVAEVDGRPVAKVIDFGVAKALGEPLVDHPAVTQERHLIGTPAYMSPEQAGPASGGVDATSDVYSLGALLYELLAGAPPFDPRELATATREALARTLAEREPIRPSRRAAGLGRGEPRLPADLDRVTLKALAKDRALRYRSAAELAEDIGRHLKGRPVAARDRTTARRALALLRRRPLAAALALALTGTIALVFLRARAAEAQLLAAREAELVAVQFAATALSAEAGRRTELDLARLLDEAAQRAYSADQPARLRAEILLRLAAARAEHDELAAARTHYEGVLELDPAELPEAAAERIEALLGLAEIHAREHRPAEAAELARRALDLEARVEPPDATAAAARRARAQRLVGGG